MLLRGAVHKRRPSLPATSKTLNVSSSRQLNGLKQPWTHSPRPNRMDMIRACGARTLAPYTRPLRAPVKISRRRRQSDYSGNPLPKCASCPHARTFDDGEDVVVGRLPDPVVDDLHRETRQQGGSKKKLKAEGEDVPQACRVRRRRRLSVVKDGETKEHKKRPTARRSIQPVPTWPCFRNDPPRLSHALKPPQIQRKRRQAMDKCYNKLCAQIFPGTIHLPKL